MLTPLMKMGLTECSETSTYKIQTPGNHQKKKEYDIQNRAKIRNKEFKPY